MTASLAFTASFKDGMGLSDTQEFALGEINIDKIGQQWSYCLFTGDVDIGQWVQDYRTDGTVDSTPSLPTGVAPSETDDHFLYVPRSTFRRAEAAIGAFGYASDQGFVITSWNPISSSVARVGVRLLHNGSERFSEPKDWSANPSTIGVYLPGRVVPGIVANLSDIRGIAQTDVTDIVSSDPDTYKFGWVLQKGIGVCKLGAAGALASGERYLEAIDGGLVGSNATPRENASARTIGRVLRDIGTGNATNLVLAEIDIDNYATSPFGRRPKRPIGAGGTVIR